jgi:hypothetical protein
VRKIENPLTQISIARTPLKRSRGAAAATPISHPALAGAPGGGGAAPEDRGRRNRLCEDADGPDKEKPHTCVPHSLSNRTKLRVVKGAKPGTVPVSRTVPTLG